MIISLQNGLKVTITDTHGMLQLGSVDCIPCDVLNVNSFSKVVVCGSVSSGFSGSGLPPEPSREWILAYLKTVQIM